MVECAGFEIRCTGLPYRGFESHPFRQVLSNWFQFLPTVSKLFGVIFQPGVRSVLTGYRSFQAFKTCISPLQRRVFCRLGTGSEPFRTVWNRLEMAVPKYPKRALDLQRRPNQAGLFVSLDVFDSVQDLAHDLQVGRPFANRPPALQA